MVTVLAAFAALTIPQLDAEVPALDDLAPLNSSSEHLVHLLLSGGTRVSENRMPLPLKNAAWTVVRSRLQDSLAEAASGSSWVGYRRPQRRDEVVVLKWEQPGFMFWWIDAEITGYLVGRSLAPFADPVDFGAAFVTSQAREWLRLPATSPAPYTFYKHGQGEHWLHGYLAFNDDVQASLSIERGLGWSRSIGVWVNQHVIIFQVSLPADESPFNPSKTGRDTRTGSRFEGVSQ